MGFSSVVTLSDAEGRFSIPELKVGSEYQVYARNNQVQSSMFIAKEGMEPIKLVLPKADRYLAGMDSHLSCD